MTDQTKQKRLGQYPTPLWVAEALVERYFSDLDAGDCVVESGCGPGAFLRALPAHVNAIGVDIDPMMAAMARRETGRQVIVGDFATVPLNVRPTAIIGNPPFKMAVIDRFLDRCLNLLPEGGRAGYILPTYAFQTAERVARYSDHWSIMQEMIPRNIYPGLSLPLVFALFSKDRRRTMVGFALYREAADVQRMADPYRRILNDCPGSMWQAVAAVALERLGGEADLQDIYGEIESHRPTRTKFWREQIRKTLRAASDKFVPTGRARYALAGGMQAAA